ncbi:hypothetical protein QWJ46_16965 [Rhizobium sp. CBN3]|uniref:hypothetical protein n=1 Tax=Rhizobium sp. CBN3 TaxID=3058045 RepID=UPI00267415B2|nr:hypothetical protein [Rhizobium sp. CBN3]MDO3434373.1 hypothetical protein [Rhizobium sp. CBN3]
MTEHPPRKRCENCSKWSSTDKVWGHCTYASSRDDDHSKIAHATYVRLGDEHQAELETKFNFSCVLWSSLKAAVKKVSR